jgi:two-component system sensor histidine kinase KdpD
MIVVVDAAGLAPDELGEALGRIRKDPKGRDVLVAIVAGDTEADWYHEQGANAVVGAPLTPAVAWTIVHRLARRPKREDGLVTGPATAEAADVPLTVLRRRVEKRMARLKIYLGAAPGVGKSYAMLNEAHDLRRRDEDVVVGFIETHRRADTEALVAGLEAMPRRVISYKGTDLEELDLDGVLARRPAIALVDELAHTNVPGSVNQKRFEDVNVLRLAGIQVITGVNIQHLESLNTIVERITGVKVRETVPDSVLDDAAEVVLVDLAPEALQKRLQAGKIYALDKVTQSLSNFFTTHNLTALRELVLRELADKVDERLEAVRADIGRSEGPTGIQDRLLVCITPAENAQSLIRRGARLADRLNGELVVLHVEDRPLRDAERKALERHFALAESLEAQVLRLRHPDPGEAIARHASTTNVSMVLLGRTRRSAWRGLVEKSVTEQVLDRTRNIDVVTVAAH